MANREAVVFDGHLPPSKASVRQARADAAVGRLRSWRSSRSSGGKNLGPGIAPALAPAVAQDVLHSLGVRVVVPMETEADAYCAALGRHLATSTASKDRRQVFVVSLDADMHVYDLGDNCRYLPIDNLSWRTAADMDAEADAGAGWLTGLAYSYADTSRRIGVPVLSLAVVMGIEGCDRPPRPASEAMALLRKQALSEIAGAEEIRAAQKTFSISSKIVQPDGESAKGSQPYGRVAELRTSKDIWLPQLIEDVAQPSAWLVSADIRAAAYALLRKRGFGAGEVCERLRRGDVVRGKAVMSAPVSDVAGLPALGSRRDINVFCLRRLRAACRQSGRGLSDAQLCASIHTLSSSTTIEHEETNASFGDWHVLAQLEGLAYSCNMLCIARSKDRVPMHDLLDAPSYFAFLSRRRGHKPHTLLSSEGRSIRSAVVTQNMTVSGTR